MGKRRKCFFSSIFFWQSWKIKGTAASENSAGFHGGELIIVQVKTDKPRSIVLIQNSHQNTLLSEKTSRYRTVGKCPICIKNIHRLFMQEYAKNYTIWERIQVNVRNWSWNTTYYFKAHECVIQFYKPG